MLVLFESPAGPVLVLVTLLKFPPLGTLDHDQWRHTFGSKSVMQIAVDIIGPQTKLTTTLNHWICTT